MAYLLLIMERSEGRRQWSEAEEPEQAEQMLRWGDGLQARGVLRASGVAPARHRGHPDRARRREALVTEGPFARIEEIVGGFFLLDVDTKEQAMAIANECPAVQWSTVEVREIGPCWPPT
jgi:hypothetical protein